MTTTIDRESALVGTIMDRVQPVWERNNPGGSFKAVRTTLVLALLGCHRKACPLDLEALAKADDFNLVHDVFGIANHFDPRTGTLGGCFLPRFARPQWGAVTTRYESGMRCPDCGGEGWSVGRITAECLSCKTVLLIGTRATSSDMIRHGSNPAGAGV